MAGLVDIHTHLLPGIDDGPDDLKGSLDMARAAVASGVATIAATPHLRADFPGVRVEEIAARCARLQEVFDREGVLLHVVSGAEVSLVWALDARDEELRLASYGQRGTDLLIETPDDVSMLDSLLFAIRAKGFRITLAHPERNMAFQRDPGRLERLAEQGVLVQINASALLRRRSPPGRLAKRLSSEGRAHVIASDGHRGAAWRPVTALSQAVKAAAEFLGPERAEWMASTAPAAITEGELLPNPPAIAERRFPTRLFGLR